MKILYRVTSPYFCAGIVVQLGKIVVTAPILSWTNGKLFVSFLAYCRHKNWDVEKIEGAL